MTTEIVFTNLDFKLLRKQKFSILKMAWKESTSKKEAEHIEGILQLIDFIQDEAEKQHGSRKVFGRLVKPLVRYGKR